MADYSDMSGEDAREDMKQIRSALERCRDAITAGVDSAVAHAAAIKEIANIADVDVSSITPTEKP